MKKGEKARASVMNTITEAFATKGDLVGCFDKKIYVTADDGNEILQFAISITMPKVPIAGTEVGNPTNHAQSGDAPASPQVTATPQPIELSEDDKAAVERLMRELNII